MKLINELKELSTENSCENDVYINVVWELRKRAKNFYNNSYINLYDYFVEVGENLKYNQVLNICKRIQTRLVDEGLKVELIDYCDARYKLYIEWGEPYIVEKSDRVF